MSITKIEAFKDRHGTMWETEEEARASEAGYDIIEYLNANPIYCGSSEASVDGTAFWLWLQEHKKRVYVLILPEDEE